MRPYVLFTPSGGQAQYAICSPISDETGTIYFKNDSGYLMALGSTITALEITRLPDKLRYQPGEVFDPTGNGGDGGIRQRRFPGCDGLCDVFSGAR